MPRPYHDDYDDIRIKKFQDANPKSMLGIGVLSLVMSLISGPGLFILIVIAALISLAQNGQMNDNDPIAMLLGMCMLGCLGLSFAGLVLGVIGAFQSQTNPTCAIIGAIFNAIILAGFVFFMILGLAMQH